MGMTKNTVFLLIGLGFYASTVLAFSGMGKALDGVTKECQDDINKLVEAKSCQSQSHDETRIDCLHRNFEKVSKPCQEKLTETHGKWEGKMKSFDEIKKACEVEIKKMAKDVNPSMHKSLVTGLMMDKDQLSKACKDKVNQHITDHLPGIRPL